MNLWVEVFYIKLKWTYLLPTFHFYAPKIPEMLLFAGVFMEYKMVTLGRNALIETEKRNWFIFLKRIRCICLTFIFSKRVSAYSLLKQNLRSRRNDSSYIIILSLLKFIECSPEAAMRGGR